MNELRVEQPDGTRFGLSFSLAPLSDVRGNLATALGEALTSMLAMFYPTILCKKANVVVTELVQNVIDNVYDPRSGMRLDLSIDGDVLQVRVTNKVTPDQFDAVRARVEQLAHVEDPKRLFAETLRSRRMQRLKGGLGLIRLVSENRFRLTASYADHHMTMQAVFSLRGAQ